jgi:type I restriction enzyme, S subunit
VKPGYKQTDVGVIPEEWRVTSLRDLVDQGRKITYGIVVPGPVAANGVPMIRAQDYSKGWVDPEDLYRVSLAVDKAYKRSKVTTGDVLLTIVGSVGNLAKVPRAFNGSNITQQTARLSFNPKVADADYYLNVLQGYIGKKALSNYTKSGVQPSLNLSDVEKFMLPAPPLREQLVISMALSDVDALLDALDRLIAKKVRLKQATMQQLLTGRTRLPGFSGEWRKSELGELGQISGAGVDKKIRPGELPVRLVNYMDVYRRSFIYSRELEHVVSAPPEQATRCAVKKGDVFFTPSSEMPFDVAMSAVAMEDIADAAYSYHVVRLRLEEDWDLLFRAYAFKSQDFLNQAARACEGSGVRYVITQSRFRQLSVRFPSIKEEQTAIATVLSNMDAELAALEQRRAKTSALKQGMVQELLTGKTRLVSSEVTHA